MAYHPLDLPQLPGPIEAVIRGGVEPLFQDVHWLMASAVPARGPNRQFQVPIAHMLLASIGGVSRVLLRPAIDDSDRKRFVRCLTFFPWDIDPPDGATPEDAALMLYKTFRNPLVHALGFDDKGGPTVKIGGTLRGTNDAESRVEALERLTVKPLSTPCLVVRDDKHVLWIDPLYWGVRKMVERWARDDSQVIAALDRLTR